MYVAVKGGEQAIKSAHQLLAEYTPWRRCCGRNQRGTNQATNAFGVGARDDRRLAFTMKNWPLWR